MMQWRNAYVVLWCCFSVLVFSCIAPTKRGNETALYAIDSLVSAQATYLATRKITLTKMSSLSARNDKVSIVPNSRAAWEKELEIFTTLDLINRPLTKNFYKTERNRDSKSNLEIKSFTATKELPVKFLRIYYHENLQKVRKIEAEYDESNMLFSGSRSLSMEFQQVDDKPILTSYTIAGGQKMFLDDTVQYSINVLLTIN